MSRRRVELDRLVMVSVITANGGYDSFKLVPFPSSSGSRPAARFSSGRRD
jgi:hypothetical protein